MGGSLKKQGAWNLRSRLYGSRYQNTDLLFLRRCLLAGRLRLPVLLRPNGAPELGGRAEERESRSCVLLLPWLQPRGRPEGEKKEREYSGGTSADGFLKEPFDERLLGPSQDLWFHGLLLAGLLSNPAKGLLGEVEPFFVKARPAGDAAASSRPASCRRLSPLNKGLLAAG